MKDRTLRALLYIRVGNNPPDAASDFKEIQTGMQEEKLKRICEESGYEPVAKIVYQGKTGLTENGMMDKIKTEIKENNIEILVAASVNRLTCDTEEFYELYNWLSDNNIMLNIEDISLKDLQVTHNGITGQEM